MSGLQMGANPLFGFSDGLEENKGTNLVFGLNAGVTLKSFTFNPNGGKNGAPSNCIDFVFDVDGTEVKDRMYEMTHAVQWKNNEMIQVTDKTSPVFIEQAENWSKRLTQLLLCFVNKEELGQKAAAHRESGKTVNTFKEYVEFCISILPENYSTVKLDLFLEYQDKIRGTATRTYLQVPPSTKFGYHVVKHVEGKPFKKEEIEMSLLTDNDLALKYVAQDGTIHKFSRNARYMRSNKAKVQSQDSANDVFSSTSSPSGDTAAASNDGGAKKIDW